MLHYPPDAGKSACYHCFAARATMVLVARFREKPRIPYQLFLRPDTLYSTILSAYRPRNPAWLPPKHHHLSSFMMSGRWAVVTVRSQNNLCGSAVVTTGFHQLRHQCVWQNPPAGYSTDVSRRRRIAARREGSVSGGIQAL